MLTLSYQRRALRFNFPARTSRGALTEHVAYYLELRDLRQSDQVGWGEAAPLAGLSPDYGPGFEAQVQQLCHLVNKQRYAFREDIEPANLVSSALPALR
ncbi:MAG: o-succinylbenzoate synthase, partial [Hymenobacter sp.]